MVNPVFHGCHQWAVTRSWAVSQYDTLVGSIVLKMYGLYFQFLSYHIYFSSKWKLFPVPVFLILFFISYLSLSSLSSLSDRYKLYIEFVYY